MKILIFITIPTTVMGSLLLPKISVAILSFNLLSIWTFIFSFFLLIFITKFYIEWLGDFFKAFPRI